MTERVSEKKRVDSTVAAALEAHRPWLSRFARRMGRGAADADDLVQETFFLALRSADAFDGRSTMRTWLYRIALNVHLDRARRDERDGRLVARLSEGVGGVAPEPIESASASEAEARVARAVERLPQMQRICLVLRVYEELPYADIASIVGSSREAVKLNLVYARRKLVEWLGDE
ncbi:MAG: RNA polymerase sigma factor [Planctomycetes bacterium]|nr:RNA polymerase sigma factor [Planctomycetota bacterium]MBI3844262.1 RNA polymerase sigma factor [Planctomycetota bacterium]